MKLLNIVIMPTKGQALCTVEGSLLSYQPEMTTKSGNMHLKKLIEELKNFIISQSCKQIFHELSLYNE
ncbi:hypothetical protein ACO2FA_13500 [Staphylococcus warneri]